MRKNKLMISAITLAFAVVAVVSTTFAWFTMNTVNTVKDLDFTATSGSGLYMSLDQTSWKTTLTSDDFAAFAVAKPTEITGFGANDKLSPVTLLQANKESLALVNEKNAPVTSGYVQFKLYFKSSVASTITAKELSVTSSDAKMVLKYNKDLTSGTDKWWKDKDTTDGGVGDGSIALSTQLAYATRVHLKGNAEQLIDPNSGVGYGTIEPTLANSVSHQYLNHVSPTDATSIEKAFGSLTENSFPTYATAIDPSTLLTLTGDATNGYTGSITVTLWVDGFDQDCFDVLFGKTLRFNVSFLATPVTPAPQQ